MKKRILLGGCAAILLAIAACIGGSLYLIDYALRPERQETDLQTAIKEECGNYPFITPWIDSLVTHKALRDTFITADDGCALHAFYVYAARPTRKTALLIHGYGGQATGMLPIGYMYNRSLDYNILLPDLRRAGQSGGEAIQMGWLDRLDVKQWIDTAPSLFGDSLRIVVHGPHLFKGICEAGQGRLVCELRGLHGRRDVRPVQSKAGGGVCGLLCGRLWIHQRVGRVQERTEDTVPPASIPAAPHGQLVVRKKIRMELPGSLGTGTSEEMQETDDVHPRSR